MTAPSWEQTVIVITVWRLQNLGTDCQLEHDNAKTWYEENQSQETKRGGRKEQ
jgi:hypothetical protein